jgi:YHS domain-containing protein
MGSLSRMMRFLLWVVVLFWGVALVRRAVEWMLRGVTGGPQRQEGTAGAPEEKQIPRRLVRDPVCGVHVAEERAVALCDDGEVLHFCSVECRDQYVGSQKKLAAHG